MIFNQTIAGSGGGETHTLSTDGEVEAFIFQCLNDATTSYYFEPVNLSYYTVELPATLPNAATSMYNVVVVFAYEKLATADNVVEVGSYEDTLYFSTETFIYLVTMNQDTVLTKPPLPITFEGTFNSSKRYVAPCTWQPTVGDKYSTTFSTDSTKVTDRNQTKTYTCVQNAGSSGYIGIESTYRAISGRSMGWAAWFTGTQVVIEATQASSGNTVSLTIDNA